MKLLVAFLSFLVLPLAEATETAPPELSTAVQQLRQAAGRWNVTTTRYADNGAVAARRERNLELRLGGPGPRAVGQGRDPRLEPVGRHALLPERTPHHARDGAGRRGRAARRDERTGRHGIPLDAGRRPARRRAAWCSGTRASASARTASSRAWKRATTAARAGSRATTSCSCARRLKPSESGGRMYHRTRPQPYVPLTVARRHRRA